MTYVRNRSAVERVQGKFWPGVALCALLLSGWFAVQKGGQEARADNGGATAKGLIALVGVNGAREHLYLIDTDTKMIMVYKSDPGSDFQLVAGRNYEADWVYMDKLPEKTLQYKANGYSAGQIQSALKRHP